MLALLLFVLLCKRACVCVSTCVWVFTSSLPFRLTVCTRSQTIYISLFINISTMCVCMRVSKQIMLAFTYLPRHPHISKPASEWVSIVAVGMLCLVLKYYVFICSLHFTRTRAHKHTLKQRQTNKVRGCCYLFDRLATSTSLPPDSCCYYFLIIFVFFLTLFCFTTLTLSPLHSRKLNQDIRCSVCLLYA